MVAASNLFEFSRQVVDVMPILVREFAKREDNELTRGKISCPQLVALEHVSRRGRATVTEVANILSVKPSSASVLLDRLFREKMLVRERDLKDRRVVWLKSTPRGRKAVSQIMNQKRRSIREIFAALSTAERAQYLKVLLKLKSKLMQDALPARAGRAAGRALLVVFIAGAIVSTAFAAESAPESLDVLAAYKLALKQSERVAISQKEIDLAQSRFYRSFDYFLPSVHYEMTRFDQDAPESGTAFGNAFRKSTPLDRFTFSQPVFSGFKEIAALQGSGADRRQQESAWRHAKETLFVDVMEAFYNVLSARRDLEILTEQKKVLSDRLEELKPRVELGRSRTGEMQSSIADQKSVEADMVTARSMAVKAENLLAFYIGKPVSGLTMVETMDASKAETPLEKALMAAAKRSDVESAENAYVVAQKKVISAQADLFPTASIDGNYYTRRPGFQDGNDWDVTFKLDVPIFEVGTTLGDIKQAYAEREQARLRSEEALRSARLDIQDAFENARASQEAKEALQAAADAAKENADLEIADYKLNLVSNLDVLDALRRQLDVNRRASSALYEAKKRAWQYQLAQGELPE